MKVVFLIDSLGPGGAERQLCTLAAFLKRQGMGVSILTYHRHDFFLPMLQAAEIEYVCVHRRSALGRMLAVRRALRRGGQDVVLAFGTAGHCAELAGLPRRRWGLVVSERLAKPKSHAGRSHCWRKLHYLADYVTANSHTNRLVIERSAPGLASRVVTVYNAVDLETFYYSPPPSPADGRPLRIVVVASFQAKKNPTGLVRAIALARAKSPATEIHLDWYGTSEDNCPVYRAAEECIERCGLRERVRLHPPSSAIGDVYRSADALALPSFFEGLPNVVCEAMACGRPILMSNVCDAENLVKNGHNGFLFDPSSPEDMARALLEFAALGRAERERMGRNSREMAERMFAPCMVASRYAEILSAAAARKRVPIEHWIPDVPQSAYRFFDRE
jgi:glycosyltransferase involved in cell wall biosynthesis